MRTRLRSDLQQLSALTQHRQMLGLRPTGSKNSLCGAACPSCAVMGDAVTLVTCMGNQSQNWWLKGVGPHHGRAERTLRSPNRSPEAKAVYPQVLAISTGGFSHLPSVFSSLRGDNEKVSTFSPVSLLLGEHHRHEAGGGMLCRADGHGLAQTRGQGIIGEKMRCSSPLLCLGVTRAALSQQSRRLVGVSHKGHFWSPEATPLSCSLWSCRTGRTVGHGWVPSVPRWWPTANLWGHGGSADTLNKPPGRDGGTLSPGDVRACEPAGFLSRAESARAWLEGGY